MQRVLESLEPSLGAGYMSSTKSFDMTHVRTKTESKPSDGGKPGKKHHVLAVRGRGQKVLWNPLDYNPIILPYPCPAGLRRSLRDKVVSRADEDPPFRSLTLSSDGGVENGDELPSLFFLPSYAYLENEQRRFRIMGFVVF